jgi:hypothetical protein
MRLLVFLGAMVLLSSCAVNRTLNAGKANKAYQKYAAADLVKDYDVFETVLKQEHPGLYWYTPADSVEYYFQQGRTQLKDSMTEIQFRYLLSSVTSKIRCGHTTVRASKNYFSGRDSLRNHQFPLNLKLWPDTAMVTTSLLRRDTGIKRGDVITAIDGRPMQQIVDSLFEYLSTDGYNLTHKYQTLSNRGVFSSLYLSRFGYKPSFTIDYIDTFGNHKRTVTPIYKPVKDTATRIGEFPPPPGRLTERQRKELSLRFARSLRIDTALSTGFMDLNTFTRDAKLHTFFRQSFKTLKRQNIQNLVIDLRANGGGSVTNSNLLTKYLAKQRFKIADTLFAVSRKSQYGRYQETRLMNWLFLNLMTRKGKDGNYHFRYFEGKYFKPRKKHHFDGQVYILSGGNTFSASTLVMQSLRAQPNVTIVGEESGGAAYGNNAWLIPEVTLPRTGVRFRLPLFRLVVDKTEQKGFGVQPEVYSLPTTPAIRRLADFKMEKVIELIKNSQKSY